MAFEHAMMPSHFDTHNREHLHVDAKLVTAGKGQRQLSGPWWPFDHQI